MGHLSGMKTLAGVVLATGALAAPSAFAFDLNDCDGFGTPCPYVTYGDGNSYSLPVNALIYDLNQGGGTGPSNPFYVNSTPGQIKDLTVIGTGSDGKPVTTNYPGADDSYPTPNSSGITFFSTVLTPDPGGAGEFTGDGADTWDVTLDALKGFLGMDQTPIFFFNNNQTNSGGAVDQNLAFWARITITAPDGTVVAMYDFTNEDAAHNPQPFATTAEGGGGVLNGNPALYTSDGAEPTAGTNAATDYVLSGGQLCFTAALQLVSCSNPAAVGGPINHNLGADQAVYAVVFPEMDTLLLNLFALADLTGYSMNVDFRMGCDPATIDPADCVGRDLSNGYEQLFISSQLNITQVAEPSIVALLGIALLGFYGTGRRKQMT